MFARLCRLTSDGDLKRRQTWDEKVEIEETEEVSPEEDADSCKEDVCTVQEVDLVANCPLPLVTPPRTPSPAQSGSALSLRSMGQRPSSLLRPKISLTWVLRGQQHHRHDNHGANGEVGAKERSPRSLKVARAPKAIREKESPSECIEKTDGCHVLQEIDKIVRQEKSVETLSDEGKQKDSDMSDDKSPSIVRDKDKVKRATSEPSLVCRELSVAASSEKHRHRRAKRAHKPRPPSRFGYEITDLDSFLTKASLERPANIPVVLSFPSVLYQTQGGTQDEVALPLGTVVNAVFKNQAWLYVQTPHGQEGYVGYAACLPLGILPQPTCGPCWEDSTDVFPRPLGNMTDTEKLRDTKSECGTRERKPKGRRGPRDAVSACGERSVDRLYLRAAANARTKGSRQTLLVIRSDYQGQGNNSISVSKGDVVALLSDHISEWFWVRSRDGREGFIPAAVAGHGFL